MRIRNGIGAVELSRGDMAAAYLLYLLVRILHSNVVMLPRLRQSLIQTASTVFFF